MAAGSSCQTSTPASSAPAPRARRSRAPTSSATSSGRPREAAGRNEPPPPPFPRRPFEGSTTRSARVLSTSTDAVATRERRRRANRIEIRDIRCRGAMKGELRWRRGAVHQYRQQRGLAPPGERAGHDAPGRGDIGLEVDSYSTPSFVLRDCMPASPFWRPDPDVELRFGGRRERRRARPRERRTARRHARGRRRHVQIVHVQELPPRTRRCRSQEQPLALRENLYRRLPRQLPADCRCRQLPGVGARGNLRCDSFILPPELVGGVTDYPSSLGCVVALQGAFAAVGVPYNVRWHALANDPVAHAAHPEAGPLGTWRPLGPAAAPRGSVFKSPTPSASPR